MALSYSVRKYDSELPVMVLAIDGCIDTQSSQEFSELIDTTLERHACPLVLDLANVSYVSSAGWCALIKHTKGIIAQHITLCVTGMQPTVRDVFELIGLDQFVSAHDNIGDAVASIAKPTVARKDS